MEQEQVKAVVIEFIANNFIVNLEQLGDNDSLVDKGILDSTGIIIIVSFVEDTYQIQINDNDITTENFGSIHAIVEYIRSQIETESV